MHHSFMRKYPVGSIPTFMKARYARRVTSCVLALVTVFALFFLGRSLASEDGYDIWKVPPGPPEQMWSKVDYDPELTDPFFEAEEWSRQDGCTACATCQDGKPVLVHHLDRDPKLTDRMLEIDEWSCQDGCKACATCRDGKPVLKNTAKCYSSYFGVRHSVNFCEALFVDAHVFDLLIHDDTPAFLDSLRVRIREGKFTCQYRIDDRVGAKWTMTRQKLTLDRKAFRKGDLIKGRIDFECLDQPINPKNIQIWGKDPTRTIKVFGVFKTVLQ